MIWIDENGIYQIILDNPIQDILMSMKQCRTTEFGTLFLLDD